MDGLRVNQARISGQLSPSQICCVGNDSHWLFAGGFLWRKAYTLFVVRLISPKFVYLIASLCSLYMAVVPFLSRWRGPISYVTLGFWIGAVFLLIAVMLPLNNGSFVALFGSAFVTALLVYGVARFAAFRLGFVQGKVQIGAYQPNAFDRVSQILTNPILVILLISSMASLLISGLITLRLRKGEHLSIP